MLSDPPKKNKKRTEQILRFSLRFPEAKLPQTKPTDTSSSHPVLGGGGGLSQVDVILKLYGFNGNFEVDRLMRLGNKYPQNIYSWGLHDPWKMVSVPKIKGS